MGEKKNWNEIQFGKQKQKTGFLIHHLSIEVKRPFAAGAQGEA